MRSNITLASAILKANTGADAIKKAPIVEHDTGIRCLRIGDLSNKRNYENWGFTEVENKYYENFKLLKDDIFIARTGNTIGVNAIIKAENVKAVFNNGMIRLRIDESNFDPMFIYYIVSSQKMQDYIQSIAYGTSTQPNMKINDLLRYELVSLELAEQKKIAHILSSIDDKIALNREMNKTLEAIAQAIFKSWFVDFEPFKEGEFVESDLGMIPKGWEVKPLPELIELNPRYSLKKGSEASYLDMANIPTDNARINEVVIREFSSGSKFMNGDTLLARITPSLENGKTAFVDFLEENEIGWGSTEFIVMRAKNPLPKEFTYFLARTDDFRSFAISNMSGTSGRQRVPNDCFEQYLMILPDVNTCKKFGEFASSVIKKMQGNDLESKTLSTLRDTLLPKLLSGEIEV